MSLKNVKYLSISFCALLVLGMGGCTLSRKLALDPSSRVFYETAQLIMTKWEKDIFKHLPDKESREEFIGDFWAKRDPDPATEENEFKEEFFRRIDYANRRFREGIPGWKTDRGRIYIYLGPPDSFEDRPMLNLPGVKGLILWIYYNQVAVTFIDEKGDGRYAMDLNPQYGYFGDLFGALERARLGYTRNEDIFGKKFLDFDVEYDKEKKEIVVSLPVKSLTFIEEEGIFKASFEFKFYLYEKKGPWNDKFQETRQFEMPEEEVVSLKKLDFTFPYELNTGRYYFDVVVDGSDIGKSRKFFNIKI
jgi:GWxTD domain-containing protein